jgi:cation:H+ antiporter
MALLALAGAFVVIVAGAELFTNGVEWLGRKMDLADGAIGSVLAAVGTALPETMIPLIAILFGGAPSAHEVGIGAILGAPFMLATLAMFVTGIVVLAASRRRPEGDTMRVQPSALLHDIRTFALAYGLAIALALVPAGANLPRAAGAIVLLVVYGWHIRRHLAEDADDEREALEPLRFHRLDRHHHRLNPHDPRVRMVAVQVVAALGLVVLGAILFVDAVDIIGEALQVNHTLLALVVAPMATELPEAFNSIIWVGDGKDTLAMGNITGAMAFQATVPTAIALLFAPESWAVSAGSGVAFLSAAIAFGSAAVIFVPVARRRLLLGRQLLAGGVFYAGYLALVIGMIVAGA